MGRATRLLTVLVILTAGLTAVPPAPSDRAEAGTSCDRVWENPGADGYWDDPFTPDFFETQWVPDGVPQPGETVCLPGDETYTVHVTVSAEVGGVIVGGQFTDRQPTLALEGTSGEALTFATDGIANHGTVRLGHPTDSTDVTLTVTSLFRNIGMVDLIEGGGGGRTLDGASTGSLLHSGTLHSASSEGIIACLGLSVVGEIDVDAGAQLAPGACPAEPVIFDGGTVVNDGLFLAAGGLAVYSDTTFGGANPIRANGQILFSGSPTGKVQAWDASIAGSIPADIELIIDDPVPGPSAFLSLSGAVTNNGVVRLTGDNLGASYLLAETHVFTNNGEVHLEQGQDGDRGLRADPPTGMFANNGLLHVESDEATFCDRVRNNPGGVIDIDATGRFGPHGFCSEEFLDLLGGEVTNDGSLFAGNVTTIGGDVSLPSTGDGVPISLRGSLTFQAGTTASGELDVVQDTALTGNVPEDITLTVRSRFAASVLHAASAATNEGTIRLTSAETATDAGLTFADTFTNNGTIELLAGSGGTRRVQGNPSGTLVNNGLLHVTSPSGQNGCMTTVNTGDGVIDVDTGAGWTTSCASPHTLNIEGGTVIADGVLGTTSVTMTGGRLSGSGTVVGTVTNSGGVVAPGASVGALTIAGGYVQAGAGRLEVEIDPGAPATVDYLAVAWNAALGGTITVDAGAVVEAPTPFIRAIGTVDGAFAEVDGVPDGWISYSTHQARVQSVVTFPDVPLAHPFFLDIAWAAGDEIVNGYADGTFRPGATATRQAVVALLYRLAGAPNGADPGCVTAPFPDVPTTHPFCGEIAWASGADVVNGFPDGTFRPTATITRQAIMALLYRLAGSPDGVTPVCSSAPFPDVPTSHPFCGEIAWAKTVGLATGFPDGSFRPAATLTRQAIAAFLHRFTEQDLLGDL